MARKISRTTTKKIYEIKYEKCPKCGQMKLWYDKSIGKMKCVNCGAEFRKMTSEV